MRYRLLGSSRILAIGIQYATASTVTTIFAITATCFTESLISIIRSAFSVILVDLQLSVKKISP